MSLPQNSKLLPKSHVFQEQITARAEDIWQTGKAEDREDES